MARIKKKGLDYFPLNTDFIHDRIVRRLVKREGDAVLGILVEAFSYIYAGEGYYVRADNGLFDDIASHLYERNADDVERVLRLAVDYGMFDAALFERAGILTSAEIQRQYLFCIRRRIHVRLEADYCLLTEEELADHKKSSSSKEALSAEAAAEAEGDNEGINVTFTPENVTFGTQSIAKKSKAKKSKEKPLFHSPLQKSGERAEEEMQEEISSVGSCGEDGGDNAAGKRRQWTQEALDGLFPPDDGLSRNYAGLRDNLRSYGIPPSEQYAIIRKSNYGAIGGPVWRGLATLRSSGGKIKLPGRYLLSVVNQRG